VLVALIGAVRVRLCKLFSRYSGIPKGCETLGSCIGLPYEIIFK
jgi:hypothetical protein